MIKISKNLDQREVEELVDRMPLDFKLKLVRKLERETYKERWGEIFSDITKRLKGSPISTKDIAKEIQAYRRNKRNNA